jgi:hypothetical protein
MLLRALAAERRAGRLGRSVDPAWLRVLGDARQSPEVQRAIDRAQTRSAAVRDALGS